jgi:hypothetical protein
MSFFSLDGIYTCRYLLRAKVSKHSRKNKKKYGHVIARGCPM